MKKLFAFSYAEHKLISDEEADNRIALYQNSVINQFDNLTTFAEYKNPSLNNTPVPSPTASPITSTQSNLITISGSGINIIEKPFHLPSGYLRHVSKRSLNYNINFPEMLCIRSSSKNNHKTEFLGSQKILVP